MLVYFREFDIHPIEKLETTIKVILMFAWSWKKLFNIVNVQITAGDKLRIIYTPIEAYRQTLEKDWWLFE